MASLLSIYGFCQVRQGAVYLDGGIMIKIGKHGFLEALSVEASQKITTDITILRA